MKKKSLTPKDGGQTKTAEVKAPQAPVKAAAKDKEKTDGNA